MEPRAWRDFTQQGESQGGGKVCDEEDDDDDDDNDYGLEERLQSSTLFYGLGSVEHCVRPIWRSPVNQTFLLMKFKRLFSVN